MPAWGFLTLHFKVLYPPAIPLEVTLSSLVSLFKTAGIAVRMGTVETLNLPQFADLDAGDCNGIPTAQMAALCAYRNGATPRDPVAYLVRSLLPPGEGCASHPPGVPACALSEGASLWALTHELGHLLDLAHVDDSDNLMTGYGAENITNLPPDLTPEQVTIMRASPLVVYDSPEVAMVRDLLMSDAPSAEKLRKLPANSASILGKIADGPDALTASRAVYFAGLSNTPGGLKLATSKLRDKRHHLRVAAKASLKGLRKPKGKKIRGKPQRSLRASKGGS